MSSIPKIDKSKYNKSKPYEWVDMQWEKFITEQRELKAKIVKLEEQRKCDDEYIEDLESDIGRLTDMVIDLKNNLKEVGGKDTYEYLYSTKNENQLELFDE
tara:strand:+ start:149 stop:451 length:303 start_codon:yes stop_codon:yes gene_type:complete